MNFQEALKRAKKLAAREKRPVAIIRDIDSYTYISLPACSSDYEKYITGVILPGGKYLGEVESLSEVLA